MPDLAPRFERQIPTGDVHQRDVCGHCGYIAYQNPKIITGAVIEAEDGRILLCRRAIEPRRGFWTIPAGFLELGETCANGAIREAWEEARARIRIESILAVYSVTHISQVQILHHARLAEPGFAPGEESLEVQLFHWDDIPWAEIAFPSVHWVLNQWYNTRGGPAGPPATAPMETMRNA